jgi:hypothetical protein
LTFETSSMLLIELKASSSYISVTLSFTQIIGFSQSPTTQNFSVQHAVEEIDEIPEFSISQSVAARAKVRIEHRMTTMYPVLRDGRGRAL